LFQQSAQWRCRSVVEKSRGKRPLGTWMILKLDLRETGYQNVKWIGLKFVNTGL
jgi:hypothetical protein